MQRVRTINTEGRGIDRFERRTVMRHVGHRLQDAAHIAAVVLLGGRTLRIQGEPCAPGSFGSSRHEPARRQSELVDFYKQFTKEW